MVEHWWDLLPGVPSTDTCPKLPTRLRRRGFRFVLPPTLCSKT